MRPRKARRTRHLITGKDTQALLRDIRRCVAHVESDSRTWAQEWSIATYEPELLLPAVPALRLRDGFRLAAYQYASGGDGNGFTFVIPRDAHLPEPPSDGFTFGWSRSGGPIFYAKGAPLPVWIRSDIGSFLDGDGSPSSYFQASLFLRYVRELGARWHGCSWSTHEVATRRRWTLGADWTWRKPEPRDLRPVVWADGRCRWHVVFHSQSALGTESLIRHDDVFIDSYEPRTREMVIAEGRGGFVH